MKQASKQYIPFQPLQWPNRQWPNKTITKAPIWCSVDLRDGNQALVTPMQLEEKLLMFKTLVDIGFKEIEVGFPSASETEYEILRTLIEGHHIPDDVTIQVLVQARPELIKKTFEAVKGAKNVIVHFYNSTSTLQRKVVFKEDMPGIIKIAVEGAKLIRQLTEEEIASSGMNIRYEYSPESFTGTEIDFAIEICEAVMETLGATNENPIILNLPSTVEMSTPNTYADQIEYFCTKMKNREAAIISIHPHNDRGTGVAAAELAMLAGADRVEGTLFGNGERTGNVPLEAMVFEYAQLKGTLDGMDTTVITELAEYFEKELGYVQPSRTPFVGSNFNVTRAGIHADGLLKNEEIYNIFDTGKFLNRPPLVSVSNTSGLAGIALWINSYYHLPKDKSVDKNSELVKKVKVWVDKQYEDGRVTVLTDKELVEEIEKCCKELNVTIGA